MAEAETCACPGCGQPAGTKKCSACKTTPYCGVRCQTEDWPHHKEECPGHLCKVGRVQIDKSDGFLRNNNFVQAIRYAEMALTKLKRLKDRSLAVIELLDDALSCKSSSLNYMGRDKEALECATEWYNMWATTNMRSPRMIEAAFPLIETLLRNKEFDKAHLIAGTVYEMTLHPMTNDIPENKQQPLLARAARMFAGAIFQMEQAGGIPPEEKQKTGEEAIVLARKALEIDSQLYGTESEQVVLAIGILASALDCFNNDDDDGEAIRLYEQVIAIRSRLSGSSSLNMAVSKYNLGSACGRRARRAEAANDLDRCVVNLEPALLHYREAARIYLALNHVETADSIAQAAKKVEEYIQRVRNIITTTSNTTAVEESR